MKPQTALTVLMASLTVTAMPTPDPPSNTATPSNETLPAQFKQTQPFRLVTTSNDLPVYLATYRTGPLTAKLAVTETLALSTTFRLNITRPSTTYIYGNLVTSQDFNDANIPFGFTVPPRLGSNLAELTMAPAGDASKKQQEDDMTEFIIDPQMRLTIDGGLDDSKTPISPPKFFGGLSRWILCKGLGYPYGEVDVIMWVLGDGKPQNPSCGEVMEIKAVPIETN
jgi:hypothetical protein